MSARAAIALFAFSAEERARLAPGRLAALAAEASRLDVDLALASADESDIGRDDLDAECLTGGEGAPRRRLKPDLVVINAQPTLDRHRRALDWLRRGFTTLETAGPDKSELAAALDATPLAPRLIGEERLPGEGVTEAIVAGARRRDSIVIKPATGDSGRGVQFLTREGELWTLRRGGDRMAGSLEDLAARVAEAIGGRARYRVYLLQDYVRSVSSDGRAVQLRIDLHKDGEGRWAVMWTGAHLGAPGRLVSNVAQGGVVVTLGAALSDRTIRLPEEIADEAVSLALALGRALDDAPGVRVHELGVDLAIDEDDRLWLLEANIRPVTTSHEQARAALAIPYYLGVANAACAR